MPNAPIVYLNDEFIPAAQAKVSVLDRGFIFGDGVYEVIPVYGGRLFRLDAHLARLEDNLINIRIAPPNSREKWLDILGNLVKRNGGNDLSVYLQITRGVAPRDHGFPKKVAPTVFIMANPLSPVPEHLLAEGVSVITTPDFRWQNCHIKSIALLANILARQQALDVGASEAVFVRDGNVSEGAASNIFYVKNRTLFTPPKGPQLLPGITRDLVLELARANHVNTREQAVTVADLESADEIWLTSSTKEILPVTQLNERQVGNGKPGPLWARMLALYQDYKQQIREGRAA